MALVLVDGHEIEIGDDERINGIEAARRVGIEIPHYCWHPGLSVVASCRMCLVEVGTRDKASGAISMLPKLVPACQTPARDGTVFVTNSVKVARARAMVEEDLLLNHPIDCPICDKAGECLLQDYHFQYGQRQRRADIRPFSSRRRSLGEHVTLFVDRCIMCSRCVRFTREIAGTAELMVRHRGSGEEIDVFPGHPLANKLSGNVVDLCPVGALGDKHFLYQQRVWFLQDHDGVCTGCATGCSTHIGVHQDRIYRLRPRANPRVNRWWMCDDGRYGFDHVHSLERLTQPEGRPLGDRTAVRTAVAESALPGRLDAALRQAGRLAVVLSPHLTAEEAYLLAMTIRRIDPQALVALGHVPVVGQDECFPGGLVIRGEKCPNRRGVEEVVAHWMDGAFTWDDLCQRLAAGAVDGVWVSGGYPDPWVDEETAARFDGLRLLIVQDLFDSPLARRADYVLPGAAFPERAGSYVNYADWFQSVTRAVRPPVGVQPEGPLLWQLLGRSGRYDARAVRGELAAEIPYFAAAAGDVSPLGVDLKVDLLASSMTADEQQAENLSDS